jgi:hypothetical protein
LREAQARGAKAWAPSTATRCEYLLSLLSGSIGKLPIADIEPADVLVAVRRIEKKGKLESARRTLQLASAVFRYAVATARLSSDPTRDLRGALTIPPSCIMERSPGNGGGTLPTNTENNARDGTVLAFLQVGNPAPTPLAGAHHRRPRLKKTHDDQRDSRPHSSPQNRARPHRAVARDALPQDPERHFPEAGADRGALRRLAGIGDQ